MISYSEILEIEQEIPSELRDMFNKYSHYLNKSILCKFDIKDTIYELEGVKAVDNTKQRFSYNKDTAIDKYYKYSDKLTALEDEYKTYKQYLKNTEGLLKTIKDNELRKKIYNCYFANAIELTKDIKID